MGTHKTSMSKEKENSGGFSLKDKAMLGVHVCVWAAVLVLLIVALTSGGEEKTGEAAAYGEANDYIRNAISMETTADIEDDYTGEVTSLHVEYRIPEIVLDSDDARAINREIRNFMEDVANENMEMVKSDLLPIFGQINYEAYLNGRVLSVLAYMIEYGGGPSNYYQAYNIDVQTGRKLSEKQLIAHGGYSEDEFRAAQRAGITDKYYEVYPMLAEEEWVLEHGDGDAFDEYRYEKYCEEYMEHCEKSVADEYLRIDDNLYFANSNECIFIAKLCSMGGADYYEYPVRLEKNSSFASETATAPDNRPEESKPAEDIAIDKELQRNLNLFLSNFSESDLGSFSGTPSTEQLLWFGLMHNHLNTYERTVEISNSYFYEDYHERISLDTADASVQKYFGVKIDRGDLDGIGFCRDGYVYCNCTGGYITSGFSVVTQLRKTGDGIYEASFDIFDESYDDWLNDDNRYSLSLDEVYACSGRRYVECVGYGTATIAAKDLDDRSTYRLDGYSVRRTWYGEATKVSMDDICAITVSGSLESVGDRTYGAGNTIDGDPDTCWIVNTTEDGAAGAWVIYDFAESCRVSGLKMINGNVYKDGYYFRNGHIKEFRLDFSDGSSMSFTAREIESRNVNDNIFTFDKPVETSWVKLTILSSYVGSKPEYRTNSAMAEIEFY